VTVPKDATIDVALFESTERLTPPSVTGGAFLLNPDPVIVILFAERLTVAVSIVWACSVDARAVKSNPARDSRTSFLAILFCMADPFDEQQFWFVIPSDREYDLSSDPKQDR
jgi:hypothetical protein